MKKFSKLKLFGFVIILTIALVFMAINFLEAKKPVPWKWEVMLPTESTGFYNLYGYGGATYYDGNYIDVEVTEGRSTINRDRVNKFQLAIDNTSGRFVDFEGFTLNSLYSEEGLPYCQFPNCSDSDSCDPPGCMEDFLNNNLHPSSEYIYFSLVIELDYDFEDMEVEAEPVEVFGMVKINVVNTWECLEENSKEYHNVSCYSYASDQGSLGCYIDIQRVEENTWTISSADIFNLRVDEHYRVYLGGSRGKGGKGKGPGDNKYPLRTNTSFNFTTTWTRSPQ
jgi:hypothetical protein